MENSISKKFNTVTLLKFVMPSIVMMSFISIYTMFGSIYAGNFINQNAMAAINIVSPLFAAVIAISVMFATGSNAIIAKNLGEGKSQVAKENLSYLYIVAIILGLILTILTFGFEDHILKVLGATSELNKYAKDYLRTLALTFPFVFLQIFSQYFCVTIGKPTMGLLFSFIAMMANLIITHLTIVVFKIGVAGAAMGMAASFVLPGITFAALLLFKRNWVLHFVKPRRHKKFLLDTCANGSSEMVTNLAISVVTIVLNLLMGKFAGEDGIASVTVIVQMQFLLNSIYIGFGAGVAPIFAFAQGMDNREQTKSVFKTSILFTSISSCILVLMCFLLRENIVGLFLSHDSPAFELAKNGFLIFAFGYLFAGTNIFASVFFTSVSNGKISALISFLRTFAFILGMLAILPLFLGSTGVWISIPIAEGLTILITVYLFKKYKSVYHY